MKATKVNEIEAESPARLRDLITALSKHTGNTVLRMEVGWCVSTRPEEGQEIGFTMTVTHSLGPEHELKIAPLLAEAFTTTLNAASAKVKAEDADDAGERRST